MQSPYVHLKKHNCPKCSGTHQRTTGEYIAEAISTHGNQYDYSLTNYVNAKTKIKIICKKHGVFEKIPR